MEKPNLLVTTDFSCGGILTSILNNTEIKFSKRFSGSVESREHDLLKFKNSQKLTWEERLLQYCPDVWYNTHEVDVDFTQFEKKIIVSTEDIKSRYIIFLRTFKFLKNKIDNNLATIDKARELAKAYALPKVVNKHKTIYSIELIDILFDNHNLFDISHPSWKKWKEKNIYIWDSNPWMEKRWKEAIYEFETGIEYKYI
jgi:hypothetical protein